MIHAEVLVDVLLKNTCTQQNNLTFLQNCLGSDYSSIAEKERKKRHQLMKG